jgi:hypothetical protein
MTTSTCVRKAAFAHNFVSFFGFKACMQRTTTFPAHPARQRLIHLILTVLPGYSLQITRVSVHRRAQSMTKRFITTDTTTNADYTRHS